LFRGAGAVTHGETKRGDSGDEGGGAKEEEFHKVKGTEVVTERRNPFRQRKFFAF